MERVWGTLQQRWPPALRHGGIRTMEAGNVYLRETLIPEYNARFGKEPAEEGTAFVAYEGRPLSDILCVQEDRVVGRDNCVSWNRRSLQIPSQTHRHHYVKATVRVHEYPDGTLAVFDGPRCLARYDANGELLDGKPKGDT